MRNDFRPQSRRQGIVTQQLKSETLIYDLTTNKAYCLNETSAKIWNLCDGDNSVAEISRRLKSDLNGSVTEDFVWLALDQLKKDALLENGSELTEPFAGMSRREVIRRVGLASVIALPMISSLIAPSAAHAQSGCVGTGTDPDGYTVDRDLAPSPTQYTCANDATCAPDAPNCCSGKSNVTNCVEQMQNGPPDTYTLIYQCVCSSQ